MQACDLESLRQAFKGHSDDELFRGWFLDGVPWIFQPDPTSFPPWRERVRNATGMAEAEVFLVGSAAIGCSLRPGEAGRPFRHDPSPGLRRSDVDIALVSEAIFTKAWNAIVASDRLRELGYRPEDTRKGIYWGHLDHNRIPRASFEMKGLFRRLLGEAVRLPPTRGYRSTVRLYRRLEDLRGYQIDSIRECRRQTSG
jgi:hypothetical protein